MTNTMKFMIGVLLILNFVLIFLQKRRIAELELCNEVQAATIESQYYALEKYGHYKGL